MQQYQMQLDQINTKIKQIELDLKKEEELKQRLQQLMKGRQQHTQDLLTKLNPWPFI